MVGDVGEGVVSGLAMLHQHTDGNGAGTPDTGATVHEHVPTDGEATPDLAQQRAQVVERRSVEVGDREPQRGCPVVAPQPVDVSGIAVFQLGALVQAHDGAGAADALERGVGIGADDVLAAQPQLAGDTGNGHLIESPIAPAIPPHVPRRHGRGGYGAGPAARRPPVTR